MCDSDSSRGEDAEPDDVPDQASPDRPALYCPICDYDLTGLPTNRCPECGREFDPTVVAGQPALRVRAWLTQGSWFKQSLTPWRVFRRPAFAMGKHARLDIGVARLFPRLVLWTVAWMAGIHLGSRAAGIGVTVVLRMPPQSFPSPLSFSLAYASQLVFKCLTWAGLSFIFAMLLLAGDRNDKADDRTFNAATVLVGVVVLFLMIGRPISTEIWYPYFDAFRPALIAVAATVCSLVFITVARQRLAVRNAREIASFVFALAVAAVSIADLAPRLLSLLLTITKVSLRLPFLWNLSKLAALGFFAISAWRGLAPLQRDRRTRLLLLFVAAACSAWVFSEDLAQLWHQWIYQPMLRGLGRL